MVANKLTTRGKILKLRPGESGILAYGSLLCRASMERTLGHPYTAPLMETTLQGWRRSWDIAMPNRTFYYSHRGRKIYPHRILYLNIRPHLVSQLNGVLFVVNQEELAAMDAREWIYNRVAVTPLLDAGAVEGGEVFAYAGKTEYVVREAASPEVVAVRATYLKIVEEGLAERSPEFRSAFERSTDWLPRHLLVEDLTGER